MVGTADELSEEDRVWLATYVLLEAAGHVSVKPDGEGNVARRQLRPVEILKDWCLSAERTNVLSGCNDSDEKKTRYLTAAKIFFAKTYCHE